MGISDFFKKEKEGGDAKVDASSIPRPPKNPKESSGAVPPPPPSFHSQNINSGKQGGPSMPPPPPGMGKRPAQQQHNMENNPSPPPAGEMPAIPKSPVQDDVDNRSGSLDDSAVPKPGDMGNMPPAPQPSRAMDLPEPPEDKFQFPEFEQGEIENLKNPVKDKKEPSDELGMDWTQSPDKEEVQVNEIIMDSPEAEQSEDDNETDEKIEEEEVMGQYPQEHQDQENDAEEIPEEEVAEPEEEVQDDFHEDSEDDDMSDESEIENVSEESRRDPKDAVHTEDGKLYVNADHYEKIFNSIREMKHGASSLEVNLHNYSKLSGDQESKYDKIAMNINEIQEQILDIDTRLFEKG